MDKDGLFLDELSDRVHEAWQAGEITNTLRSHMLTLIQNTRDSL